MQTAMQQQQQQTMRFMTGAARASQATIETANGQQTIAIDENGEPFVLQQQQPQQQQQHETDALLLMPNNTTTAASETTAAGHSAAANVLTKLTLYLCIILQVVLWPSVMTITFASVIALESLFHLFIMCVDPPRASSSASPLFESVTEYSVLFLHNRKVTTAKYIAVALVTVYMMVFFTLFVAHELRVQPVQTMWIDPSLYGTYKPFWPVTSKDSPDQSAPALTDGAPDVTGDVSKRARDPGFTWPRTLQRPAIVVNGSIHAALAPSVPLMCPAFSNGASYQCFATKLAVFPTPAGHSVYVPFASNFYAADVIITPPSGTACGTLEAYRIVLDDDLNIVSPLDYPASARIASDTTSSNTKCGLFGVSDWCLAFQHAFTPAEYTARVVQKCANGGGQLTIRLPPRAPDYYPQSGRTGQDIIVVTAGASVQVRYLWHELSAPTPLLDAWEETPSAYNDNAQAWRDSSDSSSVFFKFLIAIVPVHICWYYLTVSFHHVVADYQVLLLCLFVLLPSALTFLLVGAFLPMIGLIVCVIAINSAPFSIENKNYWGAFTRNFMLFITAACNSIQLVYVCVLIGWAGWSAFYYDVTLMQLSNLSSQFIIGATGSPAWASLTLPVCLLINLSFLVGSLVCICFEWMSSSSSLSQAAAH